MGSPSGLRLAVPTYDLLMRWCFWFYVARIAKIGLPEAKEAVAVLQLQAYIEPAGRTGKWRMTDKASWYPTPNPPIHSATTVSDLLHARAVSKSGYVCWREPAIASEVL